MFEGRPLAILREVGGRIGSEGWRRIAQSCSPPEAGRFLALLNTVLEAAALSGATVEVKVLDWERCVQEYEGATGERLRNQVKRAVLVKNAPEEVRHYIHLQAPTLADYGSVRDTV